MIFLAARVLEQEELTLGLLRLKGQFFNPWYHDILVPALWSVAFGALMAWFYYRVNDAAVFGNIAFFLVAQGVVLGFFFRDKFPLVFGMMLEAVCALGLLANLNTLGAVALVQRASYFWIEEKWITEEDGSVKREFLMATGLGILLLAAMVLPFPRAFLIASLGHNYIFYWIVLFLTAIFMGLWSYATLPWKPLKEVAILGEERPPMELQKIFSMPGPAGRGEIVIVALSVFIFYAAVLFVVKKEHHPSDYFALVAISLIAFNIIRAELFRGHAEDAPRRKSTGWY